jgi:hypothetical protein
LAKVNTAAAGLGPGWFLNFEDAPLMRHFHHYFLCDEGQNILEKIYLLESSGKSLYKAIFKMLKVYLRAMSDVITYGLLIFYEQANQIILE